MNEMVKTMNEMVKGHLYIDAELIVHLGELIG